MSVSIRFVAIAAGVAALALSPGCGQPPEEERAADSQAAGQSKMPTSPARPGEVARPHVGRSTELPAFFPDDIPIHPEAKIIETRASSDLSITILSSIEDDASEVASYYADSFAAEGWATDIHRTPEGTAVFAEKGNRFVSAMISEDRRGAKVRMIVTHK